MGHQEGGHRQEARAVAAQRPSVLSGLPQAHTCTYTNTGTTRITLRAQLTQRLIHAQTGLGHKEHPLQSHTHKYKGTLQTMKHQVPHS